MRIARIRRSGRIRQIRDGGSIRTFGVSAAASAMASALLVTTASGCGASGNATADGAGRESGRTSTSTAPTTPSVAPGTPGTPGTPSATASPPASATTPGVMATSSARLAPALLKLSDLPSGFRSEPLTTRNLPSLIHGCAGLEELQQVGVADQAQAEWTRGALDAYVDEAVIQPHGDTAAGLVEKTARALDACGSVQVAEEGLSVKLTTVPLDLAGVGDASHAWHATGRFAGVPMEMDVVIAQAGSLVVLLVQTRVAGASDDALTLQAAQAGVTRAMALQKSN